MILTVGSLIVGPLPISRGPSVFSVFSFFETSLSDQQQPDAVEASDICINRHVPCIGESNAYSNGWR